jgi:hypothetical protein
MKYPYKIKILKKIAGTSNVIRALGRTSGRLAPVAGYVLTIYYVYNISDCDCKCGN